MPTSTFELGPYLLPLARQLERIRHYNATFWNGFLSDRELESLDIRSRHRQAINDLEILHVEGKTPAETVFMHWTVIAATQPKVYRPKKVQFSSFSLREGAPIRAYEPGIHRVRVNLIANWTPTEGRTLAEVLKFAPKKGREFAHGEVLSTFSLHDELLRQMDGEAFPFMELAGYSLGAGGSVGVPVLRWERSESLVGLFPDWEDHSTRHYAAPVVLQA